MAQAEELTQYLQSGIDQLGLELTTSTISKLIDYVQLLDKWNKHYNLTAIRNKAEMIKLHILDSLAVLPYIKSGLMMDVGTGAGIPGIPLAIVADQLKVALVDSSSKKIRFCRQATIELGLEDVTAFDQRAEQLVLEQQPTQIISRALKSLPEILQIVDKHFSDQTEILAMKGKNPDKEIAVLKAMGLQVESVKLNVPYINAERHLVLINHQKARSL